MVNNEVLMRILFLSSVALLSSLSAFAGSVDMSCEGHVNKRTRLVLEKDDRDINIKIIKKTLLGRENETANLNMKIQFLQNLDSNGPYVGYENQAFGTSYVTPGLREKAELYYGEKIQLKIPYTAPGADMSDPRESTLRLPDTFPGVIKLKCKILVFG